MVNTNININEQQASYVIGINDTTYYAINCKTGVVTTNSNAATLINACISALTSGGKIKVKEGTYSITTSILINNSYITIEGNEESTKFVLSAGSNCHIFRITASNSKLCNFYIDGNKSNQSTTSSGIYILSTTVCEIKNVYITDVYSNGVSAWESNNIIVEYCDILNSGGRGIYIGVSTGYSPKNIIQYNFLTDNYDYGISVDRSSYAVISHNYIDGTTTDNGIDVNTCTLTEISYNKFLNIGKSAIGVDTCSDMTVNNNIIYSSSFTAIDVYNTTVVHVEQNKIFGTGTTTYAIGISCNVSNYSYIKNNYIANSYDVSIKLYDSDYSEIIDNTVINGAIVSDNTLAGIYVGTCTEVQVKLNRVSGSRYQSGITITNSSEVTVSSNTSHGNHWGIRVTSTASNVLVTDNKLYSNTSGKIDNTGTNVTIKYNLGYVTENKGQSTGTGVEQAIAHGCDFTPTSENIFLSEADDSTLALARPTSTTPTSTYIYVIATNGAKFNWMVTK